MLEIVSNERNYPKILLLFIVVAFFIPLGFAPLFDLDEGAFSEATREMLVGGDYITTYLNGELRFDKPILIYWLQLLSVKFFGLNEFALRLPSAIAGSFWAYAIFIFTKRVLDTKKAFFATLFMVSSLQINIIAKASIADALLNMFIVFSMFTLYIYYKNRDNRRVLHLTFLFIAFGTLTKGPIAILIPMMSSLIFFIIRGEFKEWLKMIFNPIGILIFMGIALPWYIAEYMAQGEAFIDGFFLKHNLNRFSSVMESHKGTIFYFIPVLIVGVMPFTYFAIKAIGGIRSYFKDDLKLYLSIWFIFVFIFFSLSGTKLPHYIIYGYTPLFILSTIYIERVNKRWLIYPLLIFLTILLFLPDIATFFKDDIKDKLAVVLIENSYNSFDIWYRASTLSLIGFLLVLLFRDIKDKIIILGVALVMVILINFIVIPTYGELMQQPIKEAGVLAKNRGYRNIIMYKINTPSFNLYYEGLTKSNKPQKGSIIFTKVTKLKDFKKYKTIYQKNGFALIEIN